jgi:hypothetical protein
MLLKAFYFAVPLLIVEVFYLGYRADCKTAQQREHEEGQVRYATKTWSQSNRYPSCLHAQG